MRLKRLETYGFKSFAERMTFDFEDGITAIIGPNGCGKSNIVDSIKWVVGEQSAKALRGSEMADIIFNGCATRRAMALAEVTLVLDQIGRAKGLPDDEVAITRRLTRDGHSSYWMNGRQVRLRDVREMLMDTGIGTSAYSVIEQGRIGFILDSSTKDRRAILEEAAGISRYKAHRKQASRRLERARLDLERIGQVLGEVEKRLRTVTRQAATALRYQELQGELRDLRMVFALEEYGRLTGEITALTARIEAYQETESGLAAAIGKLEVATVAMEQDLLRFEDDLREIERHRADAQSRRDVAQARGRDAKARLVEIKQQQAEEQRGGDALAGRESILVEERDRISKQLDRANPDDDDEHQISYHDKRTELDELLAHIDGLIGEIEGLKGQEVESLREIARIEAEQRRIVNTTENLTERKDRLLARAATHGETLTLAREKETHTHQATREIEARLETAHSELDERIRTREEAQAIGSELEHRLNELRHEEGRSDVRLKLLSDYERKSEGVFQGVKAVLGQADRLTGVKGLVADCFRVEERFELAVETALGTAAQFVITTTRNDAKQGIDWLRQERRGRVTFLPLDDLEPRSVRVEDFVDRPGFLGIARDLIQFENRFAPAFDHLLGGTIIVDDLDHAVALRAAGLKAKLVTLEGDIINPGGSMTGGRGAGGTSGGIVSRKNEIKRLQDRLATIVGERETLAAERDTAKQRGFEAGVAVEQQRNTIKGVERESADTKALLAKAELDRLHCEEFAASFQTELAEIDQELATVENEAVDLRGQHQWFQAMRDRLEGRLLEQQEILKGHAIRRDALQDEVSNLRVDMAASGERREGLRNRLGHIEQSIEEIQEDHEARTRRLAAMAERYEQLQRQITEDDQAHVTAAAAFNEHASRWQETVSRRDALRNVLEGKRQELRGHSHSARTSEHERQTLELQRNENRVRLEGISERILEDYEIDLAEAHHNWERPQDLDLPAVRSRLAEVEEEIGRMGPVNLAAIDELAVVQARRDYMTGHFSDLSGAADKLDEIIAGIDTTCRKLFADTYRTVRKNFQELFRKLYGGGKADLVLDTDEENPDILEAGIEIIAQPPSKQPKSISLLSGGEKALTAIALLFAVYQSKPSPFCVLDEVDAPLDDSNTDIYCAMLKEFCDKSQFLIITHNKRSMQHADAIYGITHAEPGVSTKISVKLEELDDHTHLVETAPGHGPFAD